MPDRKRTRRRAIGDLGYDSPDVEKQPSDGLRLQLEHYLSTRAAANKAASDHRGTKEELMGMMKGEGFATLRSTIGGEMVSLHTPDRNTVDLEILRKHVDEETFLRIVSASQSAVKEHVGTTLLNACLKSEKGTETLKVTKR